MFYIISGEFFFILDLFENIVQRICICLHKADFIMASVCQVSDVARGPFVLIDYNFFYIKAYPIAIEQGFFPKAR